MTLLRYKAGDRSGLTFDDVDVVGTRNLLCFYTRTGRGGEELSLRAVQVLAVTNQLMCNLFKSDFFTALGR